MANPRYGAEDRDRQAGYGRGGWFGNDGDYDRDRGRDRMRGRDDDDPDREQRSFSPRSGGWSGGDPYGDYGQGHRSDYAMDRSRHGERDYRSSSGLSGGETGPIYENQYGFSQGAQTGRYGEGRSGRQDQGQMGRRGGYGAERGGGFGAENRYLANIAEGREDQTGLHRGRGPKNYVRSDDRIREDVSDRLSDDPHLDASEIDVQVKAGEVTLTGTVEDRGAKRRAEDCIEEVSGVKHVQNNLRVTDRSSSTAGAATAQTKMRNN